MRRSMALICMIGLTALGAAAGCRARPKPARLAEGIFGLEKLWTIHIEMTAAEWEGMQPRTPDRVAAEDASASTTLPATMPTSRPVHRSNFGYGFSLARATVRFDDETVGDVGIRFKGNASYRISASGIKRPFKLDFGAFQPGRLFHGVDSLTLNNNAEEPWQMCEALSYHVFREAKLVAPRTAYARVYLTVPGEYERMYLGLYTMVEAVDLAFLQSRFGNADGLLIKPESAPYLPYLGESWERYAGAYGVIATASPESANRLIEFTELIAWGDDASFAARIGDFVDVDEFLRFIAVNVLVANLDSFLIMGHNFYAYLNPADGLFHFIPWDMNLSFGCFLSAGATVDQAELAIDRAWPVSNRLIERLMAIETHRNAYRGHLRRMAGSLLAPREMDGRIDRIQAVISEAIADEARTHSATNPALVNSKAWRYPPYPTMKEFIGRRVESINDQLEGKSTGYIPLQLRGRGRF